MHGRAVATPVQRLSRHVPGPPTSHMHTGPISCNSTSCENLSDSQDDDRPRKKKTPGVLRMCDTPVELYVVSPYCGKERQVSRFIWRWGLGLLPPEP